jgi:uncharacterized protein YukE
MSVDLTIPGDPAGIRTLADWLAPDVDGAVTEAWLELNYIWSDSQHYWTGQSGDGFRDAAARVNRESTAISPYLKRAADVFLAYANRLERGQEDFDALHEQAQAAGLVCVRRSRVVLPPATWLDYCPADTAPAEDVAEWNRYLAAVTAYRTLSEYVGAWWGELEAWLLEHMAPLVQDVEQFVPLTGVFDGFALGNEDLLDVALESAQYRTSRDYTAWNEVYQRMQADAETFTRGLRSGNPALRAASEAANPRAIRQGLEQIAETVGDLSRAGKVIPGVGIAIDVVSGVIAISEGDSASGVSAGILGGIGGGAAGGALGGVIAVALGSNPVGWVVGGAVVLSVAGSYAGRWAWEAAVPLNVRETIDDFFVGSPPTLVNEATGTWAVGTR